MPDPARLIAKLLKEDTRFDVEAYRFVFESLHYAQNELEMGTDQPSEPADAEVDPDPDPEEEMSGTEGERHLTGQELCEAMRCYALDQYGYMAKCVLNSWGVNSTHDFGEIVFNLIRIGQMRKTKEDRLEDFDNVYDFDAGLCKNFKITLPAS